MGFYVRPSEAASYERSEDNQRKDLHRFMDHDGSNRRHDNSLSEQNPKLTVCILVPVVWIGIFLSYSRWLVAFCSVMVSHFISYFLSISFFKFGFCTIYVSASPTGFVFLSEGVRAKQGVVSSHPYSFFWGISFQFECLHITLQQDQNCKDNLYVNLSTRPLILQTLKKESSLKLLVNKKL